MEYVLSNICDIFTMTILSILAFTPITQARTADGMTPAEETVCDDLSGPLYELCVTYCEAMNCDYGDHLASDQACD